MLRENEKILEFQYTFDITNTKLSLRSLIRNYFGLKALLSKCHKFRRK